MTTPTVHEIDTRRASFGSPYRDHSAKPTTGKPILVVERTSEGFKHHHFRTNDEALAWLDKVGGEED